MLKPFGAATLQPFFEVARLHEVVKVTFSREKMTFSPERVTFSDKKMTFRNLKLTFTLGPIREGEIKIY